MRQPLWGGFQGQPLVPFHGPPGAWPIPDSGSQIVGVASVAITPPAAVTNPGDTLAVSVSLTGPAVADTGLYAAIYQAPEDGTYTLIDQSEFLVPPISVLAGSTTVAFHPQYQKLLSPGNYIVSIVTEDEASQVADLSQLSQTRFASFRVQTPPVMSPPPGAQPVEVAGIAISPPAAVTNPGDILAGAVALTGPAATDTGLQAIFYEESENGTYSPMDQSDFLVPPISVPAGSTSVGFSFTYQKLSPPGNCIVAILTTDEASQITDLAEPPSTTKGAEFVIQNATEATDGMLVSGNVAILDNVGGQGNGLSAAAGVTVEAHSGVDDERVATTLTDAAGKFSLPLSIMDVPFNGYLVLTKNGLLPARVYVSRPLTRSIQVGNIFLCSPATLDLCASFVGLSSSANNQVIIVAVRDASLAGIQGAKVSFTQGGNQVGAALDTDSVPVLPQALGTSGGDVWGFNVPTGSTEIDATVPGWILDPVEIATTSNQITFVLLIADQTNETAPPTGGQDITVGGQPAALAFDGTNIWIATQADHSVWILSASDGSHVGTYPVVGTPWAMFSVGNVTWIASGDGGSGYLTEANSSAGIIRTFVLPTVPYALIAIQNDEVPDLILYFLDGNGESLWRFDPSTGQANATGPKFNSGVDLWDLLFDGTYIWISNKGEDTVVQMFPEGGPVLGTFSTGPSPTVLVFDGSILWVANNDGTVARVNVGSLERLPNLPTGAGAGANPSWMAFDGANVWITNMGSNTMTQIEASDGKVLGTHPTGPNPISVVFDGTRLWVANSGSNTVTMYQPGAPFPDPTQNA